MCCRFNPHEVLATEKKIKKIQYDIIAEKKKNLGNISSPCKLVSSTYCKLIDI